MGSGEGTRLLLEATSAELKTARLPVNSGNGAGAKYVVYGRRWYMCFIFACLSAVQGLAWNIYSPISDGLSNIYGWDASYLAMLANIAGLSMLGTIIPCGALLSFTSLRFMAVLTALLVAASCGIRCIPVDEHVHRVICVVAMVLNGLAGSGTQLLAPAISSVWFQADERTIATSIMMLFNYGGVSMGFVLGPLLVPAHGTLSDLRLLYLTEAIAAAAICVSITCYFPSKPPSPNSPSSDTDAVEKTGIMVGVKQLLDFKYWRFWLLALGFGIPSGMFSGWTAMLTPNLTHHGFDQDRAGWLGFVITMGGCVAGILSSFALDSRFLARRKKGYIVSLYLVAAASAFYFTAACSGMVASSMVTLYASAVVAGTCLNATYAVFFEVGIEETFPVSEAASSVILLLLQNGFQSVFLFLPINTWGTAWMNPAMAGTIPIFALIMLPLEIKYNRMNIDRSGCGGAHGGGLGGVAKDKIVNY